MKERRLKTRTHYIHRLKYSTQERIASAFVLVAIAALVWLLFNHSKSIIVFEEYITIYGRLATVQPINKDAEVIVGGLSAGSIKDVSITDDNSVVVTMKILERYRKLLRTDSVARLNTFNLALIDKSVIEISVGSPEMELLEDGSTIEIVESINIRELVANVKPAIDALIRTVNRIDEVMAVVRPEQLARSIDNIDTILASIEPERIDHLISTVSAITEDAQAITSHISAGKGPAGSAIYDEKMAAEIRQITENMARISVTTHELITMLNRELANLPELLEKIEPLMQEADQTLKATKRIWPLSTAVGEEREAEKLTPQAPAYD